MNSPEAVTQANLQVVAPLLREIRSLVLDKNASERRVLPRCGYTAEPDNDPSTDPVRASPPAILRPQ